MRPLSPDGAAMSSNPRPKEALKMNAKPDCPGRPALGRRGAGLVLALLAVSACTTSNAPDPLSTAEFRQARFQEIENARSYRACRDEALELDSQARVRGSAGAYLNSAQILESCESDLGGESRAVSAEERMRLKALAVLNYIRGGDIDSAQRSYDGFTAAFPDSDLYLADGSSFRNTAEVLLGRTDSLSFGAFATLNVGDDVQSEMRRLHHWKNK